MENNEWLDELPVDGTAMAEVKQLVAKWRQLKAVLVAAETAYKCAEAEYTQFIQSYMVGKLRQNGLEALTLEDGTLLTVVQQTRCSVKKDSASKEEVAAWLRSKGADALVKSELKVSNLRKDELNKLGIPFDEEVSMNTNSIKAYILGEMRVNNMTAEDLPKGLSWYQWDDINVQETK